eukprot:TRINITY_DN2491_c0_g1_i2.p2 TRINITY_DN2491_c0_g1~~TRINITY_DN2491_c0_g1_i2.p2  ORF type:complete len:360 (-),score=35.82 TRINITY_DN2491_c0_g1_i2:367-1299(-)
MHSFFSKQFSRTFGAEKCARTSPPRPSIRPTRLTRWLLTSHKQPALRTAYPNKQVVKCTCAPETTSSLSNLNIQILQPVQRKLTVAVDVDEVLARFLHSLNQYCLEVHHMRYMVEDYDLYEFAKVWGCSTAASNDIVHQFFESYHFRQGIEPIPGAFESLLRLRTLHACNLEIVTSRQNVIQASTLEWIDTYFPGVFGDRIHFCNHYSLEGKQRKKSEVCKAIGADVLIDDNPKYAVECAELGIPVLLFNWKCGYPWAMLPEEQTENPFIIQVSNWKEAESYLIQMLNGNNRVNILNGNGYSYDHGSEML